MTKHMPEAADGLANPKKLFFFLKPSTEQVLAGSPDLLRLRRRLILLIWYSLAYLFLTALLLISAMVLKL